jgi:hypothetical protein
LAVSDIAFQRGLNFESASRCRKLLEQKFYAALAVGCGCLADGSPNARTPFIGCDPRQSHWASTRFAHATPQIAANGTITLGNFTLQVHADVFEARLNAVEEMEKAQLVDQSVS